MAGDGTALKSPPANPPRQLVPPRQQRRPVSWAGFGDNLRVLEWILSDVKDGRGAVENVIGRPTLDAINRNGLDLPDDRMAARLRVDPAEWIEAVVCQGEFLAHSERAAEEMIQEHTGLARRIQRR